MVAEREIIDGEGVLRVVIPDALKRASTEIVCAVRHETLTPTTVRKSWINCLRDAFAAFYASQFASSRIAVFGGTPRNGELGNKGVPSGIPKWRRWEFMYDVAVVEWETIAAAIALDRATPSKKRAVPIVNRSIWQVESEIAGDGTKVAEDVSKLKTGLAENKLLVSSFAGQRRKEQWLDFLARAMSDANGTQFIALVPNYGRPSGYSKWQLHSVPFELYRCRPHPGGVDLMLRSCPP